jgi:hypothetical protein
MRYWPCSILSGSETVVAVVRVANADVAAVAVIPFQTFLVGSRKYC